MRTQNINVYGDLTGKCETYPAWELNLKVDSIMTIKQRSYLISCISSRHVFCGVMNMKKQSSLIFDSFRFHHHTAYSVKFQVMPCKSCFGLIVPSETLIKNFYKDFQENRLHFN